MARLHVLPPTDSGVAVRAGGRADAGVSDDLVLDVEAGPGTPRAVRRAFAERFAGHPCHDELQLCLSEVVTNAVLHAGTAITIRAGERGTTLRVEVTDGSTSMPQQRHFDVTSPTGRGLHLLDGLTREWGVVSHDAGKTVWFEIERSSSEALHPRV